MARLRKYKSLGENLCDNFSAPMEENATSSAKPATQTDQGGYWVRYFLFLCAAFLLGLAALKWADVVEFVDGEWRLKPKREAQRDKQLKNINDAEQYALVANASGYYVCRHCPSKRIFLKTNEVWKYGVTNQGEKLRYTVQFLRKRQLRYLVQLRGTYSQCLAAEKRKLFNYPVLPENLARPDSLRLVMPPGNLQMR